MSELFQQPMVDMKSKLSYKLVADMKWKLFQQTMADMKSKLSLKPLADRELPLSHARKKNNLRTASFRYSHLILLLTTVMTAVIAASRPTPSLPTL